MKTFWWRLGIGFVCLAIFLVIRFFGFFDWLTLAFVQQEVHQVRLWATEHPTLAPLGYLAVLFLGTIFFDPAAIIASIVSGSIFGFMAAVVYTIVGITLGSVAVFLMVRHGIGRSLLQEYRHYANGLNGQLDNYGAYYVIMINILPMTPTLMVNILAGLSNMRTWSFVWATALGILPGSIVYVLVGKDLSTLTSLHDLLSWQTVGLLVLLAFLVLVPMLVDHFWQRNKIGAVTKVILPNDKAKG